MCTDFLLNSSDKIKSILSSRGCSFKYKHVRFLLNDLSKYIINVTIETMPVRIGGRTNRHIQKPVLYNLTFIWVYISWNALMTSRKKQQYFTFTQQVFRSISYSHVHELFHNLCNLTHLAVYKAWIKRN